MQLTLFEVDDRLPVLKVKRGTVTRIRRATGLSYDTIRTALNFETKTPLARQIRAWAMIEGGTVEFIERNPIPHDR